MKKLRNVLIAIVALFLFVQISYTVYLRYTLVNFPHQSIELVLNTETKREHYRIGTNTNPADYGFTEYFEEEFVSEPDDIKLTGWYVPCAKGSTRTVILIHGRESNRLKPMKYLELFRETGLSRMYNVFIPDMRNSGNSDSGPTYMGWEFAEDTLACIKHVQTKYGQNSVILYGFSMGAMAIPTMYLRPELKSQLDESKVTVERIILDSPLSNARDIMVTRANTEMGIPRFMTSLGMTISDCFITGDLDMMALRNYLSTVNIPVLVLQSKADPKTPYVCFEKEQSFFNENVKVSIVEDAYHVAIYPDPRYKQQYQNTVNDFIRGRLK